MEKLKNNKGISLASVLVTVILMIIILSSIIYSNNRTDEIKKSMLINSDIEELTKKVEIYYLEKGTLPIEEVDTSIFNYKTQKNGKDVIYYKLQVSLLKNIMLNNKESITSEYSLTENDQWYVMNKQTHTIYFVKYTNSKVKLNEGSYSNKYENIITAAESLGVFNTNSIYIEESVGETTISPGVDTLVEEPTGLGTNTQLTGDGEKPDEQSGTGNVYNGVFDYVGYETTNGDKWTPGNTSPNLVVHYDGEYNTLSGSSLSHDNTTFTWSDLSGHGNNGSIVEGGWTHSFGLVDAKARSSEKNGKTWAEYEYNSTKSAMNNNPSTRSNAKNRTWNVNNLYLGYRKVNDTDINSYVVKQNPVDLPSGNADYTMEIVFYYDGSSKKAGLLGIGVYNNVITGEVIGNLGNFFTTIYNGVKIDYIINNIFQEKYGYRPYNQMSSNGAVNVAVNNTSDGEKTINYVRIGQTQYDYYNNISARYKSNAIRVSDAGKGIMSYYWDNDTVIENVLSEGVHTVTVLYGKEDDETNKQTKIYVDGALKATSTKAPNTIIREISVGATNIQTHTDLSKNGDYNKKDNGIIQFSFKYKEFLNSNVYSVRIYNKALSQNEVKQNYIIDNIRFGSGR